jgi:uncharacterized protein
MLIGAGLAGLLAAGKSGAQENPREAPEQFHRYGIDQQTITVVTRTGHYPFLVAMVHNPGDPESALTARRRVQPDEGILYLADNVQPLGISNLGVPFPTDLLFAAGDGRVIEVFPGIMANDSRIVTSSIPVKAALQVVAGTVARISAAPGDYLLNSAFGRTL